MRARVHGCLFFEAQGRTRGGMSATKRTGAGLEKKKILNRPRRPALASIDFPRRFIWPLDLPRVRSLSLLHPGILNRKAIFVPGEWTDFLCSRISESSHCSVWKYSVPACKSKRIYILLYFYEFCSIIGRRLIEKLLFHNKTTGQSSSMTFTSHNDRLCFQNYRKVNNFYNATSTHLSSAFYQQLNQRHELAYTRQ